MNYIDARKKRQPIAVFHQPEHLAWLGLIDKISQADIFVILDNVQFRKNYFQKRLNRLGRILAQKNVRLCFVGDGDVHLLNPDYVTNLGPVENNKIWDYHYFADCDIALVDGPVTNFESSKIYYYLRAGLPVVSESPLPNNYLIKEAKLGFIVPFNKPIEMAKAIERR